MLVLPYIDMKAAFNGGLGNGTAGHEQLVGVSDAQGVDVLVQTDAGVLAEQLCQTGTGDVQPAGHDLDVEVGGVVAVCKVCRLIKLHALVVGGAQRLLRGKVAHEQKIQRRAQGLEDGAALALALAVLPVHDGQDALQRLLQLGVGFQFGSDIFSP